MTKILTIAALLVFGTLNGAPAWSATKNSETAPASVEKTVAKPQRQYQELATQIGATEVIWLQDVSGEFLGLYQTDRSGLELGTALLIPDQGNHPDWPQTIGPLRRQLPDHGWHTLAMALPPLPHQPALKMPATTGETDAKSEEKPQNSPATAPPVTTPDSYQAQILARIQAAVEHLSQTRSQRLALIGRGTGAYWAAAYLEATPNTRAGLIMIDARTPAHPDDHLAAMIAQLPRPVLDLYYLDDKAAAKERISRTRRNPRANYQQNLMAQPKDHWLEEHNPLMRRIKGWAKRNL